MFEEADQDLAIKRQNGTVSVLDGSPDDE